MSTGNFPDVLSQRILAGIILVGRLGSVQFFSSPRNADPTRARASARSPNPGGLLRQGLRGGVRREGMGRPTPSAPQSAPGARRAPRRARAGVDADCLPMRRACLVVIARRPTSAYPCAGVRCGQTQAWRVRVSIQERAPQCSTAQQYASQRGAMRVAFSQVTDQRSQR